MEEKESGRQQFVKGLLWGIILMLAAGTITVIILRINGGLVFAKNTAGGSDNSRETVLSDDTQEKVGELADIIDQLFYEDVDAQGLQDGLYAGLLEGLEDPYSRYYTAEEYQSLTESTSGTYYGIGAVLSQSKSTKAVTILHVYPGSPAQEAGLKDGDILLQVEDVEGTSMELSELVKHIKGEAGSTVHLIVAREGQDEQLEFDVERRKVDVPTVEHQMLDGEVGLIQISEFSDNTVVQFRRAVKDLESQGMASMIVDLRNNPGGVLDVVCSILDDILPEGTVVYTEDKYGERKDYLSEGDSYMEYPMAVLINENSASAAEIFAGAIKDFDYGTLIGTTSFGKGIVQQIVPLNDGSAMKITTAKYYTPSGNYIHEVGITPDIELEYRSLNEENTEYDPMSDNQVQKALEILQSQ